ARGGDVDRHRRLGPVVDRRLLGAVVVALEADALLGPEQPHQPDRLRERQAALLRAGPLGASRRRLVDRLARADAEPDPSRVEARERRERVRDRRRVVAHRRREDARPEPRPLGALPEGAEPREAGRAVAAGVPERLEVVGDADELEPEPLRLDRQVEQAPRRELLRRRLVAERQRHAACILARSAGVSTSKARPGRSTTTLGTPRPACTAALPGSPNRVRTSPGGRIATAFVPPSRARAIAIPRSGVAAISSSTSSAARSGRSAEITAAT